MEKKKLVIFASGTGSLFETVYENSQNNSLPVEILSVFSDQKNSKVISKAKQKGIDTFTFKWNEKNIEHINEKLSSLKPDLILLLGFLKKIPQQIIEKFPQMINIHPSYLPDFKGLYGRGVHEQVIESKKTFTGITIHQVNENYDEGKILNQKKLPIHSKLSVDELETYVRKEEKKFLIETLKKIINKQIII